MQENGALESAETVFCRLSVQSAAEAFRRFVQWSGHGAERERSISDGSFVEGQNA
jgi:uncharacterized protein